MIGNKCMSWGGVQLFTNCTHNPKCEGGGRYLISNTFGDNL